jgi:DNA end-binding protein Ku
MSTNEADVAPRSRAFWSGTITFGLVSIPVDLFPANRPGRTSLRMLAPDGTPLRRQFFEAETEKRILSDEVVRGFEIDKDDFVVVTDAELESLEPRKTRDIDLRLFIDAGSLEPLFFERAYFLTPSGNSNKAYRLLAETMERTGKAGIATFVMRTKEYLVAILAENGILRAETLRFHDEVRTPEDVGLPEPGDAPAAAVKRVAADIRKLMKKDLAVSELKDAYAERLRKLVESKRKRGVDVVEADGPAAADEDDDDDDIIDLMQVLKRSMKAAEEREPSPARKPAAGLGRKRASPARQKSVRAPSRTAARGSSPAKKAAAGKSPAKKSPVGKSAVKNAAAKKAAAKTTTAKKTAASKSPARKTASRKTAASKSPAKKSAAKKAAAK